MNKPYDIFGTWFSDRHLLSGDLHWLAHLVSTSVLWLNKASQESESEHVPIMNQLYKFYNCNASSIRAVMVANCLAPSLPECDSEAGCAIHKSQSSSERGNPPSHSPMSLSVEPDEEESRLQYVFSLVFLPINVPITYQETSLLFIITTILCFYFYS